MIQKPLETSIFLILPKVLPFALYDKAVQVKNAYGPKAISDGTAYGKQDTGGASKVPLMVNRESVVLSIFMKDGQTTWVFSSSAGIKGKYVSQGSYHMVVTEALQSCPTQ